MSELDNFDEESLKVNMVKKLLFVVALILLAVGGLNIYDNFSHPEAKKAAEPAPAPKPITAPPVQVVSAPLAVAASAPLTAASAPQAVPASAATAAVSAAQASSLPPAAPAPQVAPLQQPAAAQQAAPLRKDVAEKKAGPAPVLSAPIGEIKEIVPRGKKAAAKVQAERQTGEEYLLQVGLFASIDNAEKIVARLKARNLTPKVESRVRAGPFRDPGELEEALKKLHAAGVGGVKAAAGENYLQAGLFSSVASAKQMAAKLQANGVAARTETRVRLGPFASKVHAEKARKKLHDFGIDSILVPAR